MPSIYWPSWPFYLGLEPVLVIIQNAPEVHRFWGFYLISVTFKTIVYICGSKVGSKMNGLKHRFNVSVTYFYYLFYYLFVVSRTFHVSGPHTPSTAIFAHA